MIKQFLKDRKEAFLSLDRKKIEKYCRKYDVPIPKKDKVFWAGIHKARLGLKDMSEQEKNKSTVWLIKNGFMPFFNPENVADYETK